VTISSMTVGGSLLKIRSSSRRFISSGRKNWPTDARTASRVWAVIEPSGVVDPGSYSALSCQLLRNTKTRQLTLNQGLMSSK